MERLYPVLRTEIPTAISVEFQPKCISSSPGNTNKGYSSSQTFFMSQLLTNRIVNLHAPFRIELFHLNPSSYDEFHVSSLVSTEPSLPYALISASTQIHFAPFSSASTSPPSSSFSIPNISSAFQDDPDILRQFDHHINENPSLIIVSGPPGSGKTSSLRRYLNQHLTGAFKFIDRKSVV